MSRYLLFLWPLLVVGCTAVPSPTALPLATHTPFAPELATPTIAPEPTIRLTLAASPANQPTNLAEQYADYEIITLLPQDAIPAIDNPSFLDAATADSEYAPDELVMGVVFNGEARAYSVPHLSSHEIVNDTVGGVKIAVTW